MKINTIVWPRMTADLCGHLAGCVATLMDDSTLIRDKELEPFVLAVRDAQTEQEQRHAMKEFLLYLAFKLKEAR